ncbi:hypothetical protein LNV08_00005, partial [Paucibacter sp. TC2R-5]|uniref:hypothetical protein n=1 Tax=Paucibacter sp. TC2R-5 TaxID=2893555 RepID=UPI0021E4A085
MLVLNMKKILVASLLIAVLMPGYILSDNAYADKIISENNLKNPRDIFFYLTANKVQAPIGSPVLAGDSFVHMMHRKGGWLWCDEAAIAMAIMAQRLNYKT